jgi:pantothenate kinase
MTLSPPEDIAARILSAASGRNRLIAAIAGPPGAGKSTLAQALLGILNAHDPECAALVPMDGYHYDNPILQAQGLLERKGAPETFNAHGLLSDLGRIKAQTHHVAVPLFDRANDLARANAAIIAREHLVVLVEGNYLLLDRPVWREMTPILDLTIFLTVDEAELERRLIARWLDHGLDQAAAEARARANDLRNAETVNTESQQADVILRSS